MDNLLKRFNEGSLSDTIAQTQSQLKTQPQNETLRFLLAQFYLLSHQYDKAMVHLNILEKSTVKNIERAFAIHCYQKIAAALDSRHRFFNEKKMIDVDVTTLSTHALQRLLCRLIGNSQQENAEGEIRLNLSLTLDRIDGVQLSGEWVDPDDLLHGFVECISPQGSYRLCSINDIQSITFEPPQKPLDCLLQRVQLTWKQTADVEQQTETLLHINQYPFTHERLIDLNMTDWESDLIPNFILGLGQKIICVNEHVLPISQIKHIRFV